MSRESFINRDGKLTKSHLRAKKQEREVADRFKGKITPGSGNGKHHKGDVRVKGVARIECKTTKHKSFSVTREMIEKIEEASLSHGEVPIIIVEFINERGVPEKEVAVIPTYALNDLLDR